ncbi:MAG: TonB-dependent receptor [Bacteroidota bacterium]
MRWLIAVFILAIGSSISRAQSLDSIKINENYERKPLVEILKQWRKKYNLKIAYDAELIVNIEVSKEFIDEPVNQALNDILVGTSLDFITVNDKIAIIPRVPKVELPEKRISKTLSVKGRVKDVDTGETLPNATIQIGNISKGTVSNVDGFFSLLNIPSDTTTLHISYLGYMSKKIRLTPEMDLQNLTVDLQTNVKLLEDITVSDTYDKSIEVTDIVSKTAFNPRSMTSLPSLGELDLFKTIQLMPGVSGENESSANLIIRGSLPSQNLVLLDGFTIYHLDHFFGLFSALNPDVVKDVQVYKGGFESKYGGRVGGVVDIVGKSGNTNKPTLNLGLNLISARATYETPIGSKFNMLVSLRRAFTDVIQSGLYNKLFSRPLKST